MQEKQFGVWCLYAANHTHRQEDLFRTSLPPRPAPFLEKIRLLSRDAFKVNPLACTD